MEADSLVFRNREIERRARNYVIDDDFDFVVAERAHFGRHRAFEVVDEFVGRTSDEFQRFCHLQFAFECMTETCATIMQ